MLLSICIPSYNRFEELKKILCSISQASSADFDVFVIDNGSPLPFEDNVLLDKRFHFIKRKNVVPGPINLRTSLNYGDGKYRMLCLDKDYIDGRYLDSFIRKLEMINSPCGYCCLNSENDIGKFKVNDIPIEDSIYRCGHPSGYFFREDIVKKDDMTVEVFDKKSVFYNNPFLSDLLYAFGLFEGCEAVYDGKLIITETLEKAQRTMSYTYTSRNQNIYFVPECRRKQLSILLEHMRIVGIGKEKQIKIASKLVRRTMLDCTLQYKRIMKNQAICDHHGIETKNISFKEMLQEAKALSALFMSTSLTTLSGHKKGIMIVDAWVTFLIRFMAGK